MALRKNTTFSYILQYFDQLYFGIQVFCSQRKQLFNIFTRGIKIQAFFTNFVTIFCNLQYLNSIFIFSFNTKKSLYSLKITLFLCISFNHQFLQWIQLITWYRCRQKFQCQYFYVFTKFLGLILQIFVNIFILFFKIGINFYSLNFSSTFHFKQTILMNSCLVDSFNHQFIIVFQYISIILYERMLFNVVIWQQFLHITNFLMRYCLKISFFKIIIMQLNIFRLNLLYSIVLHGFLCLLNYYILQHLKNQRYISKIYKKSLLPKYIYILFMMIGNLI